MEAAEGGSEELHGVQVLSRTSEAPAGDVTGGSSKRDGLRAISLKAAASLRLMAGLS